MTVCDILSILRQPSEGKAVSVNKPYTEECTVSHAPEFLVGSNNHIKEEECSGTVRQELRQKGSEHDIMIKVIKSEPTEVKIKTEKSEIPENGRVPPARSSSFHFRYKFAFMLLFLYIR